MSPSPTLWTVGHSNHELQTLLDLVHSQQIDYVVDVRSYPYSRFAPHFNREDLQAALERRQLGYLFLGEALGGRPQSSDHLDREGHALYYRMAELPAFQEAIERLLRGAGEHRLALLCSCGNPEHCHRRLLVGRVLCERGAQLFHILPNAKIMVEQQVLLGEQPSAKTLFGHDEPVWRSAQSVSHRRRLSTSSRA
jgi:uncharacterized protein (DUF488 family)